MSGKREMLGTTAHSFVPCGMPIHRCKFQNCLELDNRSACTFCQMTEGSSGFMVQPPWRAVFAARGNERDRRAHAGSASRSAASRRS
jgi:hypothetical protein